MPQPKYTPAPAKVDEVAKIFTYHSPKEDQPERYEFLRSQAFKLANQILELVPPSREQALALTHLETSIMYANAAIARHE